MAPHAVACRPTPSRLVALGVVVLLAATALDVPASTVCTGPRYFSVDTGLPLGYEFSGPSSVPDSSQTCVYVSTSFRTTGLRVLQLHRQPRLLVQGPR